MSGRGHAFETVVILYRCRRYHDPGEGDRNTEHCGVSRPRLPDNPWNRVLSFGVARDLPRPFDAQWNRSKRRLFQSFSLNWLCTEACTAAALSSTGRRSTAQSTKMRTRRAIRRMPRTPRKTRPAMPHGSEKMSSMIVLPLTGGGIGGGKGGYGATGGEGGDGGDGGREEDGDGGGGEGYAASHIMQRACIANRKRRMEGRKRGVVRFVCLREILFVGGCKEEVEETMEETMEELEGIESQFLKRLGRKRFETIACLSSCFLFCSRPCLVFFAFFDNGLFFYSSFILFLFYFLFFVHPLFFHPPFILRSSFVFHSLKRTSCAVCPSKSLIACSAECYRR